MLWFEWMVVCSCWCVLFFFFSSRRRHTRLQGDWSSDVCSSDLCRCSSCPRVWPANALPDCRGGGSRLLRLWCGSIDSNGPRRALVPSAIRVYHHFRAYLRQRGECDVAVAGSVKA